MRWNKRASLEIGVNTIVILVIAMTLLGLGVVFVRNLFQKVGGTVSIIEPGDISNPPTSDKPIKLVPGSIDNLKSGASTIVDVLVYNKDKSQKFSLTIGPCTVLAPGEKPYMESIPGMQIDQGNYIGFKTNIYAAKDSSGKKGAAIDPATYICEITATGDQGASYADSFTMGVTS